MDGIKLRINLANFRFCGLGLNVFGSSQYTLLFYLLPYFTIKESYSYETKIYHNIPNKMYCMSSTIGGKPKWAKVWAWMSHDVDGFFLNHYA